MPAVLFWYPLLPANLLDSPRCCKSIPSSKYTPFSMSRLHVPLATFSRAFYFDGVKRLFQLPHDSLPLTALPFVIADYTCRWHWSRRGTEEDKKKDEKGGKIRKRCHGRPWYGSWYLMFVLLVGVVEDEISVNYGMWKAPYIVLVKNPNIGVFIAKQCCFLCLCLCKPMLFNVKFEKLPYLALRIGCKWWVVCHPWKVSLQQLAACTQIQ